MPSRATIIADLRAHLAKVAPVREPSPPISTGIDALDAQIGGWPQPGIAHIHGAIGSGRMGLILPAIRAHTQAGRTVAIVDPVGWLYPPGLPNVDLRHVMLVRCGNVQAGWAATQLAGSGALPMTVLLDPPPLSQDASRLLRSTESGQSTVIVLTETPDPRLSAQVRLRCMGDGEMRIERGTLGNTGTSFRLGL